MCSVLPLGALRYETNEYVYPAIANKEDRYKCPECLKELILRKGLIRTPHFAHCRDSDPCNYYTKPSEAQIHKDAKMVLKKILESKKQLVIVRKCPGIHPDKCMEWKGPNEFEIPDVDETSQIILEYRFDYNGDKIADVCFTDSGEIVCIFEIYNTHRTDEKDRPDPWFEIKAADLIHAANLSDSDTIRVNCVRNVVCDDCALKPCTRCNRPYQTYLLNIWNSNGKGYCMACNAETWNVCYLNVPFADKEKIKKYGGRFDSYCKKWYIPNDSKYKNAVLEKWKEWKL